MKRLLQRLSTAGFTPDDSDDDRLQKSVLTLISAMTVLAGVIWGSVYGVMGLARVAVIPMGYSAAVVLALAYFVRTKSYRLFRQIQLIAILVLPFLMQWALGGFTGSSAVMIWALLSPMGALMFAESGHAARLFVAFLALTALSGLADPVLARHDPHLPPAFVDAFFVLNLAGVATIAYVLLQYFTRQRALAQERSEELLLNILPAAIAQRLKSSRGVIADSFNEVTILFADIVDFTRLSAELTPQEVVALLDEIFSDFDRLAQRHRLEKIKTIGDAYMVVGGLPEPRADHATAVAEMALEMLEALETYRERTGLPLHLRIGINSGPVTAGVIGQRKFIYDIWGDAVNMASRMESSGIANVIQTTATTAALLRDGYEIEERGPIDIKGKGRVTTYLLKGRRAPGPARR